MELKLWVLLFMILLVPFFFWYRVKTYRKRRDRLVARCPSCGHDNHLEEVQNYACEKCGEEVAFFGENGGSDSAQKYTCRVCGEENFVGILSCVGCGMSHPESIPK